MSIEYDQERIIDRIEFARKRMERQVAADEIKGDLCNFVRELQTDEVKKKLLILSQTPGAEELYKYIRKIELINNSIYCINCDAIKHVPGWNEKVVTVDVTTVDATTSSKMSAVSNEQATIATASLERKLSQLEASINDAYEAFQTNMKAAAEFYNHLIADANTARKKYLSSDEPIECNKGTPTERLQTPSERLQTPSERLQTPAASSLPMPSERLQTPSSLLLNAINKRVKTNLATDRALNGANLSSFLNMNGLD